MGAKLRCHDTVGFFPLFPLSFNAHHLFKRKECNNYEEKASMIENSRTKAFEIPNGGHEKEPNEKKDESSSQSRDFGPRCTRYPFEKSVLQNMMVGSNPGV